MISLGAATAFAMDAGGSAQLAVGTDLVIPWSAPRSLSDVVLLSYGGVTLTPLPFRLSANGDHVDDSATEVVRSPAAGVATVTIARRTGRPTKRLWQGPLGPGAVKVNVDPKRLGLGDGVYVVRGQVHSGRRQRRDRAAPTRDLRPHALGPDRALDDDRRRQASPGPAGRRLPPAAPRPRDRAGRSRRRAARSRRSPRNRRLPPGARSGWPGTACAASALVSGTVHGHRRRRTAASAPRACSAPSP